MKIETLGGRIWSYTSSWELPSGLLSTSGFPLQKNIFGENLAPGTKHLWSSPILVLCPALPGCARLCPAIGGGYFEGKSPYLMVGGKIVHEKVFFELMTKFQTF